MSKFLQALLGTVVGLLIVGVIAVGAVAGGIVSLPFLIGKDAVKHESETRESLVVRAVTTTQEISLVSLGVQGIVERSDNTTIFGRKIPGSDRASFLQYEFNAKLGVDGKDVRIEQNPDSEDTFTITVPPFKFIGHDDVSFKMAVEKNGVLSMLTPDIDTIEMTNEILNGESKQDLVTKYEDQLKAQTRLFYSSIIEGIDPTIKLEFKFLGSER